MKRAVFCLVVAGMLMIGSLAGAQEVLYDNFEGKTLDVTKWYGNSDTGSGMVTLETSRLMKNETLLKSKALSLSTRTYVRDDSNSGTSTAHNGIVFADGSNIKTIVATVLVKKIQLPECGSRSDVQPFDTYVRARIGGAFFNTGTPTEGSYLNDVYAWIGVGRTIPTEDPPDTLHVYARVVRCDNASCSNTTWVSYEDPQDLGTVKLNKKVKLRIAWDPDNNRFIFQKGKDAEFYISYTYDDANPPGASNGGTKRLQIQNILPNCTDEPRLFGYIDASFDNIMVSE
jgi:hypothetical protein